MLGQLVDLPDATIIIMRNGSTQETYKLGTVNFTFDITKDSIGITGVPCYDYTFNIDGNTLNILALDKINPSDTPSVPLLDITQVLSHIGIKMVVIIQIIFLVAL